MAHSSDEEDTDISDSEISEYEEKCYEELKNGSQNVKTSDEKFTCPYCPKKRKRDYLYNELLQHASGVGQSSSQKRKPREKATHLALVKYLEKDLMNVDTPSSEPAENGDTDTPIDSDEQFVWPWIGIIVNIPTNRAQDGRSVGASGPKLRDEYRRRGFNPYRVNPLWNFRGHSGTALVEFYKNWPGLDNALAFEKAYASEHHGKKDWFVNTEPKSGLYAWVARADDYRKNNIIGDYLRKMGNIKTIPELMEEEARRQDKLVSNLTSIIEVKNKHLHEIEARCTETTAKMNSAMTEKDQLIQDYNEGNMSTREDVPDEVNESSVPSSKKARTSSAWNYFEKYIDEKGDPRAKCKNCSKSYMAKEDSGTTNLNKHLLKCVEEDVSSYPPLNQEKYRELISEVIVKNNYPFSFVEHDGIEDLHAFLHPQVKGISRNTAKSDVLKLYIKEKENLKCYLRSIPGKICLTSDLWTAINTDQYMVLIAHYVNKRWELEKKVLAFFHFPPPHTGVNLAEKLISLLRDWGIERKIFTITLDNASNNDAMVNILKKHPTFGSSLTLDGAYFHVRCGAHVLNLIVHEGIRVVDGSILDKIRMCVKYIRGSESRKQKFTSCLEQLPEVTSKQLRQDMPIRWNSTYLMLESAVGLREGFTLLQDIDPHFNSLSDEEWIEAQKIADFLKPFYDITTLFSGSTYPTANLYFSGVWRIQMKIKEVACVYHNELENQDQICCMAKRMKTKFDKYWNSYSVILSFAVILDPRFKLQFVEYCYVKMFGDDGVKIADAILEKLKVFFQEYLKSSNELSGTSSQRSIRGSPIIPLSDLTDFGNYQSKLCGPSRKESDLQSYLDEERLNHEHYANLDILEYWKANEGKYPEVSMMARDVLSIPITTVASESSFSIGGRILDKYRSALLPDNVEALLCTHDWLCGTPDGINLDGHQFLEDLSAFSSMRIS